MANETKEPIADMDNWRQYIPSMPIGSTLMVGGRLTVTKVARVLDSKHDLEYIVSYPLDPDSPASDQTIATLNTLEDCLIFLREFINNGHSITRPTESR